jgi:hypothetical protein
VGQVIEGVLPCELAGMDEAQEHIPHVSAVLGLEEQGVLTVEDGALQGTLTDIMPTARLCRIGGSDEPPSCFCVFADAA